MIPDRQDELRHELERQNPLRYLGHGGNMHFPAEQDQFYTRIFGAVAWPAVRPGFIVIVGEHRSGRVGGLPLLVLLDEATDGRLWHVVEKAAAFRFYYKPERFYADCRHVAAMQFAADFREGGLVLEHSLLCAMDGPFGYALPILARLHDDTQRLIVPKTSLMYGELKSAPAHEELAKLRLSDYPAISALAFAVLGLERTRDEDRGPRQTEIGWPGKVLG
jgi:hypothetical protein